MGPAVRHAVRTPDEKALLRVRMRDALAAVPPRQRALEEELVNAAILADPRWAQAHTVLLHRSVGTELSVVSLGNAAFRLGKRVLFPRVDEGGLALHEAQGWHDLRPGAFGIPEPAASQPQAGPDEVDLAVVPGLAWDDDGRRLGRGGGHYDRLLARLEGASWGVGFDVQRVERVPMETHDRGVDQVWTAALVQADQT